MYLLLLLLLALSWTDSFPFSSPLPEFFKFKGFGSLSNLPRSFTLRRSSAPTSIRPNLKPEIFETTQDDMVTVPKSPLAYARSSDMCSHMGTMPRHSINRSRDRQAAQEAREVPRSLPDPPRMEAAKEVVATEAPLEDTEVKPHPSAVEVSPTKKPEDPKTDMEEERVPRNVPPER